MSDEFNYCNQRDCVSRETLYKEFKRHFTAPKDWRKLAKIIIDATPPADVAPVVHGHWQERQTISGYTYECSVCKGHITYDEHGEEVFSDFCPYCSAILDEEVNEEDTGVKNEYLKLSPKKAESEDINNER